MTIMNRHAGVTTATVLTGYPDRLSVAPGETVRFMVSAEGVRRYRADITRIVCGDINPAGPGFREVPVRSPVSGSYRGRTQACRPGSCVRIINTALVDDLTSFSIQAFVWPTLFGRGPQIILGRFLATARRGFALAIDDGGALALVLGDGRRVQTIASRVPMLLRHWYFVAATYDADGQTVRLYQERLVPNPRIASAARRRVRVRVAPAPAAVPMLIGAWATSTLPDGDPIAGGFFNGRIDRPRLAALALDRAELEALKTDTVPPHLASATVAAWDFGAEMSGTRVVDRSVNGLDGETINLPTRAVRGHNWTGEALDWRQAPAQYAAIHFHEDDIYDAGWQTDFTLKVPTAWPSGFYAAHLRATGAEGRIAFFVRPPRRRTTAPLAFLVSTATYMAYANFKPTPSPFTELMTGRLSVMHPANLVLDAHPEWGASLYDRHSDGSGICYSSRLRPIQNMQPKYIRFSGGHGSSLREYNADTHFIGWLEAMGQRYDVITDEDLEHEGWDLLRGYRAVMTCSHPEYTSKRMWDALKAYTDRGGRLMYLGGNGFYWRIAFHPALPGVIEVRRAGPAVRSWADEPGESHMSFDGAMGGLWRNQGRTPQALAGVGFISQGFDLSASYRRTAASFDPRAQFIFAGVGADEVIGDFGLEGGGAAGIEIDAADTALGTPPHALIVASSEGHTESFLLVTEELDIMRPDVTAPDNPRVRADIVFYETPNGGAVFSVGSIAWAGSLSHNGYRNNVSRITGNVLRRFVRRAPF